MVLSVERLAGSAVGGAQRAYGRQDAHVVPSAPADASSVGGRGRHRPGAGRHLLGLSEVRAHPPVADRSLCRLRGAKLENRIPLRRPPSWCRGRQRGGKDGENE